MELASPSSTGRPNLRVRFSEPQRMTVSALKESTWKLVKSDFREDLGAQEVGLVDEQDGMNVGGVGHAGARRRGAGGVVVIVAGGIKAQVGAAHASVGVGVDQASLADVAPAVVNE